MVTTARLLTSDVNIPDDTKSAALTANWPDPSADSLTSQKTEARYLLAEPETLVPDSSAFIVITANGIWITV